MHCLLGMLKARACLAEICQMSYSKTMTHASQTNSRLVNSTQCQVCDAACTLCNTKPPPGP